jgi:hypothetical protein
LHTVKPEYWPTELLVIHTEVLGIYKNLFADQLKYICRYRTPAYYWDFRVEGRGKSIVWPPRDYWLVEPAS